MLAPSIGLAQVASPPQIIGHLASCIRKLSHVRRGHSERRRLFGDTDDTFDSVCRGQIHNDDSQGVLPLQPPATGVPPLTFLTDPNDPNVLQRLLVFRGYGPSGAAVELGQHAGGRGAELRRAQCPLGEAQRRQLRSTGGAAPGGTPSCCCSCCRASCSVPSPSTS